MSTQPLSLPTDFDGEVRLFPLPNVVLFPGNVLPLHIFESRYREMLEDAIQDDQLITMATLKPGYEPDYVSRPPLASAVCIGRVTEHECTEKGTYNLILVGLQRAEIEHEIEPVRSFRRARVRLLEEVDADTSQHSGKNVAAELADRVAKVFPATQELVQDFRNGRIPLSSLTDILAFHLPLEMDSKLHLLEEADATTRAELLLAALPKPPAPPKRKPYPHPFSDN